MYRTATIAVYDVMSEVFCSVSINEYSGMPGDSDVTRITLHTTTASTGSDDWQEWLVSSLRGCIAETQK